MDVEEPGGFDDLGDEARFIGPFRILERIESGGMGIVYLAERRTPVEQRVALKVIRSDRLDRTYQARFAMEQSALARMDHPNIARLFDAGEDQGRSWYAMEHVPGVVLTEYCRRHRLTVESRLAIFLQICDGVQHAHMKGILHRDLKPGNILVREVDGRPQVKIIDFGLAQPVDPLQIRATLHEALHTIVGTLAYMSPEQADRVEGDLDTRTDVFSLGVVLYELLTGKVPIEADQIKRAGMLDVGGLLREYVPQKPSTRLSQLGPELATAAAERSLSPGHLCARIRGELDWVTMKAIANDRGRRYASVQDLRRDIERFLQNRPVHAGPPSAWYSARKWAQRHLAGLLVAAVLVLGGAAFLATAGSLAAKAKEAELRRELVAKAWLIGDYLERADDELWPADAEHAPAMRAWLRETEHYPDLDVELHAFAAELRSQLDSLGAGVERDVVQSQLRQVEAGRDYFAKLGPARERIAARLERALTLRQRTVAAYEAAWQRARDELKEDDRFVDFALPDIPGLVPLGLNPTSGLQEFYLLDNGRGAIPSKQDHDYEVTADTGLIFVLIPARACGPPGTPDRCEVSPFLMSRYEMTQAQWVRLLAEGEIDAEEADRLNPSLETERIQSVCGVIELFPSPEKRKLLGFSAPNWVHPVQGMSWPVAQSRLARAGLQLPTMSEWNVCAYRIVNSRLTTDGLWSGGRGRYVNFWDRFGDAWFASGDLGAQDPDDDWDGFVFTCPVDALAPNELGLHGTFGNVAEYTCDSAESDPLADGGPQANLPAAAADSALLMGGSFATSAQRTNDAVDNSVQKYVHGTRGEVAGVRPVIRIPGR